MKASKSQLDTQFQSTLPMRGATLEIDVAYLRAIISIHAPHAGSD